MGHINLVQNFTIFIENSGKMVEDGEKSNIFNLCIK